MTNLVINENNFSKSYSVNENEEALFSLALLNNFNNHDSKILVNRDGKLTLAIADFSSGTGKIKIDVTLEEGASLNIHLASLSQKSDKKTFDLCVYHKSPRSNALVSCHGIAKDESHLLFLGESNIAKGSHGTKTRQEGRIIVFDPKANGEVSPTLLIDDNDVQASHGATVGKLNDEHLFYLQSRGLSANQAKTLITLGYLTPILNYFDDEKIKEAINETIRRSFNA